jgi:hypothetical protein
LQNPALQQKDYRRYCYKNKNEKIYDGQKIPVKISDMDLSVIKNNCNNPDVPCDVNNMVYCKNGDCNNCNNGMWKTIDTFNIEN